MATEAFSRVLIDQALKDSGWNLLDRHRVRFELPGRSGRADYVLSGGHGPLCVLEAKREDADPYDAKEQARGYAENLNAPFIILSNGREHWFWNHARADQRDAYRIERLPSPEDLERLRLKNLQPPRPLLSERIGLTATPKAYLKNIDAGKLHAENPKALEARLLRDTYHYFGCTPGEPTYRYDITDAVKDPEGPFLCLPKIVDVRSDVTTQALDDKGWAVTINEQDEDYKIQDLERKIFVPARNRLMCEAFLQYAQRDPGGNLGKTIVFAVNQNHATALTKILNELQPGLAITITSRIPDASTIAKEFRDGKRKERVAVSVDMLSTGYNCRDLLNIALMRPIFSPTEYIQIKGRGTRRYTFRIGHTEYEKQCFYLLDFCAVAEYFEEKYDYTVPLSLPKPKTEAQPKLIGAYPPIDSGESQVCDAERDKQEIPVWEGRDIVVFEEVRIIGPNGEKVDAMTFRGCFVRDVSAFARKDGEFNVAVEDEDDDTVETLLQERFFHRPEMYYSTDKLVRAYGVPAPTPSFVYDALGRKRLPTRDEIVKDTVDSIAARYNLRYNDQKWLNALAQLVTDDAVALLKFMTGDMTIFSASQFNPLGGVSALLRFHEREQVFEALRQSSLVRQSLQKELAA
jgi:hypothetical protein